MKEFLYVLVLVFGIVLFSFLIINVKYYFKGQVLKKTCSSQAGESCVCEKDGLKKKSCESKETLA